MRRLRLLVLALPCALLSLPAGTAMAEEPPTVTIVAPVKVFAAGTDLIVRVEVRNGGGAEVTVGAQLNGQTYALNCGGTPVYDDDFDCAVGLYLNTRIFVTFNGDVVAVRNLAVRPVMATQLKTSHYQSGRYAVMARGKSPKFTSTSLPSRPGQMCLVHEVQRLRAGVWRTVVRTGCRTEGDKGSVTWTWAGTHPRAVSFRVRAVFRGDELNAPGPGRWLYFRFR